MTRPARTLPVIWVSTLAAAAIAIPVTASAARGPSLAERLAVTRALPARVRNVPAGCVWLEVRMSSKPGWAAVTPRWLVGHAAGDPCVRFAADGRYVLRRRPTGWRVVFEGSDLPACTLGVPRDLGACAG